MNKIFCTVALGIFATTAMGQQTVPDVPDNQVEPEESIAEASVVKQKDTTNNFKRIKLDGIASVVGDYVILDSDIAKTLIDLKSQGASTEDITHCGLLGKLMEDRLYAHQAVQDSILVSKRMTNSQFVENIGVVNGDIGYYQIAGEQ